MKKKFFETYRMQKNWWLGLLSLLALPNMIRHLRGLTNEPLIYLGFLSLLYFLPEKRGAPYKISPKEIEFYRNNREEIDNITNPEKVRYKFLFSVFLMGLVFVIISKTAYPIFQFVLPTLWLEVLRDTLFELGVAIWGGSITVYLIQVLSVREEKESEEKKEMILQILGEEVVAIGVVTMTELLNAKLNLLNEEVFM